MSRLGEHVDIADQIAVLAAQHIPYEAISGKLYCSNRDCKPPTAEADAAFHWPLHVAEVIKNELGLTQVWSDDVGGPEWQRYSYWRTATENHPGSKRIAAGLT